MCGIVALISKNKQGFYQPEIHDVFSQLLLADVVRGADGTGIMYDQGKQIKVLKSGLPSYDFMRTEDWKKAKQEIWQQSNFVVGHNRWATKGKLEAKNSHPFKEGHITLVHNGTIENHKKLADVEVDSHAICKSIAEVGIKDTLVKLNGAYTLIWVDNKNKTFNWVRNWKRPLWKIETNDYTMLLSEKDLGIWVINRNDDKVENIEEVKVDEHYQIEFGEWKKIVSAPINTYVPPAVVHDNYKPRTKGVNYYEWPDDAASLFQKGTTTPIHQKRAGYIDQKSKYVSEPKVVAPALGSVITFSPLEIPKDYPRCLTGVYSDVEGDVYVKHWGEPEEIKNLMAADFCTGFVTHIQQAPEVTIYVRDVKPYEYSEEKNKPVTTRNGVKLTPVEVLALRPSCSCCSQWVNKKQLQAYEVDKKAGTVYCPECCEAEVIKRQADEFIQQAKGAI